MPPAPGTLADTDLNVVGPIARSVDDLELTLDVLAGAHGHQAAGWRLELPEARATALRGLRLAAWLDDAAYPLESETRRVLVHAVDALRAAGARVADTHPDVELPEVVRTYQQLLYPILLGTMAKESFDGFVALASQLPDEDDGGLARSVRFATLRHRDWLFAHERREQIRATMADFFRDVDALLMPVTVVPAIPHDHSEPFTERVIRADGGERPYTDLFGWIALTTLAYLPATVVPVGKTRDGLPVGVQIVGPYLEDRTTLAAGRCVSEVLGGFTPPPGASRP
jgi:amidase